MSIATLRGTTLRIMFLTRFHKSRSCGFAICDPYSALISVNQDSDSDEEPLVNLGLKTVASSFEGGGSVSACRLSLSKGMLLLNVSLSTSVKSSSRQRTNLGIEFRSANNHVMGACRRRRSSLLLLSIIANATPQAGLCCLSKML